MLRLLFVLMGSILFVASADQARAQSSSLWDHNGSTVDLFADGSRRAFRYADARSGVRNEGVKKGTVLFKGMKIGNMYIGRAYVFSRYCGAFAYDVRGRVSADEKQIRLYGRAPFGIGRGCRPSGYRSDVLNFRLMKVYKRPAVVGKVKPLEVPAWIGEEIEKRRLKREQEKEQKRVGQPRVFIGSYAAVVKSCRSYNVTACERVVKLEAVGTSDRNLALSWLAKARQFSFYKDACKAGSASGCDFALAFPAVGRERRRVIEAWRSRIRPVSKKRSYASDAISTGSAAVSKLKKNVGDLPIGLVGLVIWMVVVLGLGFAGMYARGRRISAAVGGSAGNGGGNEGINKEWEGLSATPSLGASVSAGVEPKSEAPEPYQTAAAVDALKLANSYLRELDEPIGDALDDPIKAAHFLETVTLASKQIAIAEDNDATATITVEAQDGEQITKDVSGLKAEALFYEAMCRAGEDMKRAAKIMEQAIALKPAIPQFYFTYGIFHQRMMNKKKAVEALERAVNLEPDNIEYRKELDRTRNIPESEVVIAKGMEAGRKGVNILSWIGATLSIILFILLFVALVQNDMKTAFGAFVLLVIMGAIIKGIEYVRSLPGRAKKWIDEA